MYPAGITSSASGTGDFAIPAASSRRKHIGPTIIPQNQSQQHHSSIQGQGQYQHSNQSPNHNPQYNNGYYRQQMPPQQQQKQQIPPQQIPPQQQMPPQQRSRHHHPPPPQQQYQNQIPQSNYQQQYPQQMPPQQMSSPPQQQPYPQQQYPQQQPYPQQQYQQNQQPQRKQYQGQAQPQPQPQQQQDQFYNSNTNNSVPYNPSRSSSAATSNYSDHNQQQQQQQQQPAHSYINHALQQEEYHPIPMNQQYDQPQQQQYDQPQQLQQQQQQYYNDPQSEQDTSFSETPVKKKSSKSTKSSSKTTKTPKPQKLDPEEDARIRQLEEKIQLLEKALALQDLNNSNNSMSSIHSNNSGNSSIYQPQTSSSSSNIPISSIPISISSNIPISSNILENNNGNTDINPSNPINENKKFQQLQEQRKNSVISPPPLPPLPSVSSMRKSPSPRDTFSSNERERLSISTSNSNPQSTLSIDESQSFRNSQANSLIPDSQETEDVEDSPKLEQGQQGKQGQQGQQRSLGATHKSVTSANLRMTSDFFEFEGEDEEDDPPPSYAELEQSGSLTYSGSIYRTGFEKAGFQMNHVNVPLPDINLSNYDNEKITSKKNNLKLKRKLPPPISEEGSSANVSSSADATPSTNTINNNKKNKDKSEADPNSINVSTPKNSQSVFEDASATPAFFSDESDNQSQPQLQQQFQQEIQQQLKKQKEQQNLEEQLLELKVQQKQLQEQESQRKYMEQQQQQQQQQQQIQSDPPIIPPLPGSNYKSHFNPPAVNGNNYQNLNQQQQHITMPKASTGPPKEMKHQMPTLEHRSTATSRITSQTMPDLFKNQSVVDEEKSKNEIDNIRAVRLSNDIIKPILPSESEEPVDAVIERFRASRKRALIDCNDFTPSIQFEWAITLLETVSRSDVLSRMAIDGKIRKKAINYKNLKSQRQQFVNTGVKVLTRLLQVAPNATRARLYLGDIYSGGIHPGIIPKDDEKGYKLFYDAALKQEDPVAYYRVACCLEVGIGVEQNVPLSYEFFNKAAELGDPSAMCQLGMFAFAGSNNQVSNVAQSIYWHQKAADGLKDPKVMGDNPLISARSFSDSRGALYTLAKLHQTDLNILCLNKDSPRAKSTINQLISLGVFRNLNGGLYYYLEAAKLKHREAMAALGFIYATGYFPTSNFTKDKESSGNKPFTAVDSKKSIYWYSKAAAADHVYASMGLAKWYGSGANGVLKQDPEQGFLWMKKAADEGGLSDAEYMVGCCFESGFGCEKNKSRAVVYFRRASSKNHQGAISKLQKLNSN